MPTTNKGLWVAPRQVGVCICVGNVLVHVQIKCGKFNGANEDVSEIVYLHSIRNASGRESREGNCIHLVASSLISVSHLA